VAGLFENGIEKKLREGGTKYNTGTIEAYSSASQPSEAEQTEHTVLDSVPSSGGARKKSDVKKGRWGRKSTQPKQISSKLPSKPVDAEAFNN